MKYAKTLSIVIPVYNSEKTISPLVDALQSYLASIIKFDIILVNDGSKDNSIQVLRSVSEKYENVTALGLSRNFGQHNAIMAGLNYATGDLVMTMDDDLQHPVEEVEKLLEKIEEGYDVVYGEYMVKSHSILKNIGSEMNNIMANVMIKKPKSLRFTSFRIMRTFLVKEMVKYNAPYPYIDGLILRITRNIGTITITHESRKIGRSNYTFKKLFTLWMNGFLNFSIIPLRAFIYTGFVMATLGFLATMIVLIEALFLFTPLPGWTTLIVAVMLFSGVQLVSIGMVGEYVGRIFLTQNKTPQYVVREKIVKAATTIAKDTTSQARSQVEDHYPQAYEYRGYDFSTSDRLS